MFYGLTFVLAAVSPVFPVISIEAWAVFAGLVGQRPWLLTALAAALGQLLCFTLLYFAGRRIAPRLPWLGRKLRQFEPGRYQRHATGFACSAALVGVPPLSLMTLAAPVLAVPFPLFAVIAFTGRLLRLAALVAFAQKAQTWFPVDRLPEWLRSVSVVNMNCLFDAPGK